MTGIKATSLCKRFKHRTVVSDVSLTVNRGQVVGLLGPNGAGKTTSFNMIAGLLLADAGKVLIDGRDVTHEPMHRRARLGLGYLPQESSVFRMLSVSDNLHAVLQIRGGLTKKDRKKKVDGLLADLHIEHIADSPGYALSGGERRRVEIARALVVDPVFILLDEPFAGVDPIAVRDIQGIICLLSKQGIGVLITDHNVRETLGVCDHAYIVSAGKVIAEGDAEVVLHHPQVRSAYLGDDFRMHG